uniref:DUF5641 domain-containing protein n=1 Tax=Amphimedon queenslandica TaxID=400682 RepID=A0A1X7UQF8_AMPQE
MIKSTKTCLKKTVGKARLTYEDLLTSLTEVEMIVNSRLLTYLSADEMEEPITPSHLLIWRRVLTLPQIPQSSDEGYGTPITHSKVIRRMNHLQQTLDHFWDRWRWEYLVELRSVHRYPTRSGGSQISLGQIVIIYDEKQPRGLSRLGSVKGLKKSSDGEFRGAKVFTHSEGGCLWY